MAWDPANTALLTLDCQMGIFDLVPGAEAILPQAMLALDAARRIGIPILHVGLGFAAGHPEIPDGIPFATRFKAKNRFVKGSVEAEVHPALYRPGETLIHKQRIAAFSENQLHLVLRAGRIENLILFGIATSGIVLSTLRRAYDLDYRCTVIADACHDRDPEVHGVLTRKVFAGQAEVLTAEAFAERAEAPGN